MSTHSMLLRCKKCEQEKERDPEFYMIMEYYNKESLIKVANETKCPECGSEDWYMTDGCER